MFRYMPRAILIAVLLPFTACQPHDAEEARGDSVATGQRPNIIVIVVDDLRWDEL